MDGASGDGRRHCSQSSGTRPSVPHPLHRFTQRCPLSVVAERPIHALAREGRWEFRDVGTLKRLTQVLSKRSAPFRASDYWEKRHLALDGSLRAVGHIGLTDEVNARQYERKREAVEQLLQRWVPEARGKRLLDAGCGVGAFAATYLSAGFEVHGVDFSPTAIARACERFPDAHFTVSSLENLALGESFDVIVAVDVLLHIVDDGAWRRVLGALARHLTMGGVFVIVDTASDRPVATATHVRVRSVDEWQDVFRRIGVGLLEHTRLELPAENATKDVFVLRR